LCWCSWGVAVGGVMVLFLVDCDLWPSKFPLYDAFILALVTWVFDTLVHAYGDYAAVSCLAHLNCLGIFLPESFGGKLNFLMFIYSGLLFLNATW
jgi:hypothetical protein